MFIGIKKDQLVCEVLGLPVHQRAVWKSPRLHIEYVLGEEFRCHAALIPKTRNEILVVISAEEANRTTKALELEQVPHLFSLSAVAEALGSVSIPLGQDPLAAIADSFQTQGGKNAIESRVRQAVWWLKFGLAGKANDDYLASYMRILSLLQFTPGIAFPNFGAIDYEAGQPEGDYGVILLVWLERYLAELTEELRLILNNPSLSVTIEVLASSDDVGLCYDETHHLWQQHYGTMWGPFDV